MTTTHETSVVDAVRWNGTRRVWVATCSCGWSTPVGSRKGAESANGWHLTDAATPLPEWDVRNRKQVGSA